MQLKIPNYELTPYPYILSALPRYLLPFVSTNNPACAAPGLLEAQRSPNNVSDDYCDDFLLSSRRGIFCASWMRSQCLSSCCYHSDMPHFGSLLSHRIDGL